jgi:hypothetical protein
VRRACSCLGSHNLCTSDSIDNLIGEGISCPLIQPAGSEYIRRRREQMSNSESLKLKIKYSEEPYKSMAHHRIPDGDVDEHAYTPASGCGRPQAGSRLFSLSNFSPYSVLKIQSVSLRKRTTRYIDPSTLWLPESAARLSYFSHPSL